jgi:uncharacterized protein
MTNAALSAATEAANAAEKAMAVITLAGHDLSADTSGALYWPEERTLIVADMHLEKGSSYASRGQMLPPYDSAVTLASLNRVVARYRPRRLIALGDSFHDTRAGERMEANGREALAALARSLEMVWITGNHDPEIPSILPGARLAELTIRSLIFRHEPAPSPQPGEVAGHLHPAARIVTERGRVRRKAFVTDGARLIMPAFGAYAGGLNLQDPAIRTLFDARRMIAHVCGKTRIYKVALSQLKPD